MSELAWRFFRWMGEPSKLKGLAWRFFFWITPPWLSRKFQMYGFRLFAERYPGVVDRKIRAALVQGFGPTLSEEELAALSKDALDLFLHPPTREQVLEQVRKRRLSQIGPHP